MAKVLTAKQLLRRGDLKLQGFKNGKKTSLRTTKTQLRRHPTAQFVEMKDYKGNRLTKAYGLSGESSLDWGHTVTAYPMRGKRQR